VQAPLPAGKGGSWLYLIYTALLAAGRPGQRGEATARGCTHSRLIW
jgi:hypothetical protein